MDRTDNVYVAGVVDTGDLSTGGHGLKLAVERRDPDDGTRVWRRTVADSGPNVTLESLALNFQGNVAVGGTEHRRDGNDGIVLARLHALGHLRQTWRYPLPPAYRSASLQALALGDNEKMRFLGQLSTSYASEMHLSSSVLWGTCSQDGHLVSQSLFDVGPHLPNHINAFAYTEQNGLVAVGQAGLAYGKNALCVLGYWLHPSRSNRGTRVLGSLRCPKVIWEPWFPNHFGTTPLRTEEGSIEPLFLARSPVSIPLFRFSF